MEASTMPTEIDVEILHAADGTRLAKSFRLINGEIEKEPYPFVKRFTSHHLTVTSLQELAVELKAHAAQGGCLLWTNP